MGFTTYGLGTFDALQAPFRVPGIALESTLPVSIAGATETVTKYRVADELLLALPFVALPAELGAVSQQFMARQINTGGLPEPTYFASISAAGTTWASSPGGRGTTTDFGVELIGRSGTIPPFGTVRFKRVSEAIRADSLMVNGELRPDVLKAQVELARVSILRNLMLSVLQSLLDPLYDDSTRELLGLSGYANLTPMFDGQNIPWSAVSASTYPTMTALCWLELLVHPSDGGFGAGPDAFVMSSRALYMLKRELYLKGITPEYHASPLTGREHLHFNNIPVLTSRVKESVTAGANSEIWALKLRGPSAIRVLHVGGDSMEYGLREEPRMLVGQSPATTPPVDLSNASQGVEVFGVYSLVVPEVQSLARVTGVPATAPLVFI